MKRGDVVLIAGQSGPASKPRPCLIVQRTSTLDGAPKVTICPLSASIKVGSAVRPLLHPSPANGLEHISQVEIDWVFTYETRRIGRTIGTLDELSMRQVDTALRRWLDL